MENQSPENAPLNPENQSDSSLWLTDRLLQNLQNTAKWGSATVILIALLGGSSLFLALYYFYHFGISLSGKSFYLFEGANLYKVLNLAASLTFYFLLAKGLWNGWKAWRFLKNSASDDADLLEGTEHLGKMFRWLTYAVAIYLGFLVAQIAFRELMSLMGGSYRL